MVGKRVIEDNVGDVFTLAEPFGVDNSVAAGFRIGVKDGAAFYDYSADSVAELFSSYLNPRIAKLMKEASK